MRSIESGEVFGRWTVLSVCGAKAACRCECGTERQVSINSLTSGRSKSCCCGRNTPKGESNRAWKGDNARAETKRARCQRAYKLDKCEKCDSPATDRHHKDRDTGNNVRENISFLCRSCHMKEDGRLEALKKAGAESSKRRIKPPKPCSVCALPSKPTWKGKCHRCDMYYRKTGRDWTPDVGKPMPPRSCVVCTKLTDRPAKGRCHACYEFWRRNGKERR